MRAERDAQIVERPVIHIDFIANIQPETEGSPEAFNTSARIRSEAGGPVGNTVSNIGDARRYAGIGATEIDQSNLARHKHAEWAGAAKLKFWSEQGGDGAKA